MKKETKVHLIGVGDFGLTEVGVCEDPCPLGIGDQKNSVSFVCFGVLCGSGSMRCFVGMVDDLGYILTFILDRFFHLSFVHRWFNSP